MTKAREGLNERIDVLRSLVAGALRTFRDDRGQAMVEYALILALVTVVGVVGLALIPSFPVRIFNAMTNAFP